MEDFLRAGQFAEHWEGMVNPKRQTRFLLFLRLGIPLGPLSLFPVVQTPLRGLWLCSLPSWKLRNKIKSHCLSNTWCSTLNVSDISLFPLRFLFTWHLKHLKNTVSQELQKNDETDNNERNKATTFCRRWKPDTGPKESRVRASMACHAFVSMSQVLPLISFKWWKNGVLWWPTLLTKM